MIIEVCFICYIVMIFSTKVVLVIQSPGERNYSRRHARVGTGDTAMLKNVLIIASQPYDISLSLEQLWRNVYLRMSSCRLGLGHFLPAWRRRSII